MKLTEKRLAEMSKGEKMLRDLLSHGDEQQKEKETDERSDKGAEKDD